MGDAVMKLRTAQTRSKKPKAEMFQVHDRGAVISISTAMGLGSQNKTTKDEGAWAPRWMGEGTEIILQKGEGARDSKRGGENN